MFPSGMKFRFLVEIGKNPKLDCSFVLYKMEGSMQTIFRRKHDKKVNLKAFERSTVSTLLIPKHLTKKLDLVFACCIKYQNK